LSETSIGTGARRESVQPSLWDRLVDDLPGLRAECARLGETLAARLGAERVARLRDGGRRAVEAEADLDLADRRALATLVSLQERLSALEMRGVVVTAEVLREAVRRDIEALFNTERFEAVPLLSEAERGLADSPAELIADFPNVRRSVLNYGVPAFSGRRARDFDTEALARELKEVVATYEPRLKRDTIRVRVGSGERAGLRIDIEATLMLSPVPERLRLATLVDLDSGQAATRLEER
jgi:type VI secretion system protein ImpF